MAFTVSRRTLWIALVVAVVLVILILIVIRMRSKSNYAYPADAATQAKTTRTILSVTRPSSDVVTITTTASHGYAAGDVVLIGSPAVAYIILGTPSPTTSVFSISVATASLIAAQTLFPANTSIIPAYQTLTDALEQCNINYENNPTTYDLTACINTQTSAYYTSMCPWTTNTTQASMPSSVSTAYTTYQTQISATVSGANANSIGKAYNGVKNAASTDMMAIVNAARKADITGATRRYLSTVCPNYYTKADGTTTESANYPAWDVFSGTSTASGGGSAPTYYFDSSKIKFANATEKTAAATRLREWAKYAATYNTLIPGTATGPLITGSTLYSATTTGSSVPNWKLAQQYGPGTVNTSLGFALPWNTPENTFTVSDTTYKLN